MSTFMLLCDGMPDTTINARHAAYVSTPNAADSELAHSTEHAANGEPADSTAHADNLEPADITAHADNSEAMCTTDPSPVLSYHVR